MAGMEHHSAASAYRARVGAGSWISLIRYELLACWLALLPGALGFLLRRWLWGPGLFAQCGPQPVFGRNISLFHPGRMWFGARVAIDDDCRLDAVRCQPGEFVLEDDVIISRGSLLSAMHGPLRLGPRVSLGVNCSLYSAGGIEIGADSMLAANCYVGGGSYSVRGTLDRPMASQLEPGRGVVIGEDCWLGAGVTVIDGVAIGRGSVVAAGAVVIGDVEPYSIMAGVPARCVGHRRSVET